jgi:CBS-domain-containing membrane protein
MKAEDVMTRSIVTARPDSTVQEIAALMVEKRISGVPVVDDAGKIVGMVSESDLLHRHEVGTDHKRKWWARLLADSDDVARDYAKAHGLHARDVMTRYVISVRPDADLADVADILDNNRIKRVPVVADGRLVGLVTRGDLVRALVRSKASRPAKVMDNGALHKLLQERIRREPWNSVDQNYVRLIVNDGVVEVWGYVESEDQHSALRALIEETDGVTRIDDKLIVGLPTRHGQRVV